MACLFTDTELLDRWREGDTQAGNDLFRRHFRSVYRFFRDKVSGEEDELIQATFLACVRGRDQFRHDGSFRAYLFSLARNELYRHLRRLARDANLDFSVTSLAAVTPSPSSAMAYDERQAILAGALRQLPLQQQLVIELHYWEDVRARELAEIFEIAEPTARLWLFRARQALRVQLDRVGSLPLRGVRGSDELDGWLQSVREREGGPANDDGHDA
jgi:RNA polymerase sigma factor (sigma-70 family)